MTGFGADGPLGSLPGYDAAIQAMAGLMSINGEADRDPLRVGLPVVDMVTGLNAVIGVLLALHERGGSGKGQLVDAALYDAGISLLHPHAANWFMNQKIPGRSGNAHPNIYPYDVVNTGTSPIFLAVGNDRQFKLMCKHLGQDALADDPQYATAGQRSVNRAQLKPLLEQAFAVLDGVQLADDLMAIGVPAAPVLNVEQALQAPHTMHRELVVKMGEYTGLGAPVKLSRTPASYRFEPLTEGMAFLDAANDA